MLRKVTLPPWLDGQTIALLTLLTALGAMMQNGFANIGGEMAQMRGEMAQIRGEMGQLRDQMQREVGQLRGEMGQLRDQMQREMGQLRTDLRRIDDRLRNVELDVAAIKVGMSTLSDRVAVLEAHHTDMSPQMSHEPAEASPPS